MIATLSITLLGQKVDGVNQAMVSQSVGVIAESHGSVARADGDIRSGPWFNDFRDCDRHVRLILRNDFDDFTIPQRSDRSQRILNPPPSCRLISSGVEPPPKDERRHPEERDERSRFHSPHAGDHADVQPDQGQEARLDVFLNEPGDRPRDGSRGGRVHGQRDQGEEQQSLERNEGPIGAGMWEMAMSEGDARQSQDRQVLKRQASDQAAARTTGRL